MKTLKLKDIEALFKSSITVRSIAEQLESCKADDDASVVATHMNELDFDVAGINDGNETYAYVERSALGSGSCKDHQQTFHLSELVADSTSLMELLPLMKNSPRFFVLCGNRVDGIVSHSDLQKPPVRMLLFSMLSLLEMVLLRLVQTYYPHDSWKGKLGGSRLKGVTDLQAQRKARNEAIELADCLQFCDKRDLVLGCADARAYLGFKTKGEGDRILTQAENLRNKLAHA
jgi:hypothetical protein